MIRLARQSDHSESPGSTEPEPEEFVWPPPIEEYLAPVEVDPRRETAALVDARPAAGPDVDPPMPLMQVVAASASYGWQDGVLVALQLVDQLCPTGKEPAGSFPDLEQVALSPTGFLLTQLEAPDREPLAGLGRLLRQLLGQTELPPVLRLLMMQSASARALLSFEGVVRDLKVWDRSPRLPELADLYQRVRHCRPVSRDSTSGALQTAAQTKAPPSRDTSRRRTLSTRLLFGAAATGVFVGSVAALYYVGARVPGSQMGAPTELVAEINDASLVSTAAADTLSAADTGRPPATTRSVRTPAGTVPSRRTGSPVTSQPSLVDLPSAPISDLAAPGPVDAPAGLLPMASAPPGPAVAPSSGASALSARVSPEASPPSARPAPASLPVDLAQGRYSAAVLAQAEEQFRRGRLLFEQQQYVAAAAAFGEVARTLERGDPALALRVIAAELAEASRALSSSTGDISGRVYTAADEDVTEPVSLAQLPPRITQGTAPELIGVLELLIDSRGSVESAHLVGADQHFRDRWLVSAAKAWRFEPATRNGQPVRFLKRLTFRGSGGASP